MSEFAIIGLGRFGRAVARNLVNQEQAVLAIDRNPQRLEPVTEEVESIAVADTTDESAVRGLHLERVQCVVVAIGSRATEASLLTTAILNEIEVPRIVVRAFDTRHARLLLSIGAHEVFQPEDELGRTLAVRLAHPTIVAQVDLGGISVAEVEAPESFAGTALGDLEILNAAELTVLGIRRDDTIRTHPEGDARIRSGDLLVLMGSPSAIKQVAALQ